METSISHIENTVKDIFPVGEFVKNGERIDA